MLIYGNIYHLINWINIISHADFYNQQQRFCYTRSTHSTKKTQKFWTQMYLFLKIIPIQLSTLFPATLKKFDIVFMILTALLFKIANNCRLLHHWKIVSILETENNPIWLNLATKLHEVVIQTLLLTSLILVITIMDLYADALS